MDIKSRPPSKEYDIGYDRIFNSVHNDPISIRKEINKCDHWYKEQWGNMGEHWWQCIRCGKIKSEEGNNNETV